MKALAAVWMLQAGTQISVSHHLARGMIFFSSSANFFVSVAVMFIFQLPAMTVLRYLRFMVFSSPLCVRSILNIALSAIQRAISGCLPPFSPAGPSFYTQFRPICQASAPPGRPGRALAGPAGRPGILLVQQAGHAGQLFSLQELQRRTAAGHSRSAACGGRSEAGSRMRHDRRPRQGPGIVQPRRWIGGGRGDYLSRRHATPGSSLPSRNSRLAPPPVEMWVILSA